MPVVSTVLYLQTHPFAKLPHLMYTDLFNLRGHRFFDDIIHTTPTSSYQFLLLHLSLSFASRVSRLARLHLQALGQASKFGCPYSLAI